MMDRGNMSNITDPNHPVVLFIPEAGIYSFMRGLAVLGDAIQKRGGRIFVTRCTGQMIRNIMMAKNKLPIDTSLAQRSCIQKQIDRILMYVRRTYNFSFIELSELVDLELMKQIDALVDEATHELECVTYEGFPVGKIAQYDFILETKYKYSKFLSPEHRALYGVYVKNTALTIAMMNRLCKRYDPSIFITFNEYAQCQAVRYSALQNHVARMAIAYPTHLNVDASRIFIWKTTCEYWRYKHCQNWHLAKDVPIREKDVIACWEDSMFRMFESGSHIFSSRKKNDVTTIFTQLQLHPKKKTVVVYTSSQDERISVETAMKIWGEDACVVDAYGSQIEWLSALRDFVAKRDDVQIVVRIHPREGLRGHGFASQNLQQLKATFVERQKDFIIIWPDDPLSSYDLMELADVCLVNWSLMGQEAARLGIPVLASTKNMFYPDDDFMQTAGSPDEYEKKLEAMLHMKYTWQHLLKAVRYYHWRIFIPSLDVSETVPATCSDDTLWPEAPPSKVDVICDILSDKQDLLTYNIQEWKASLTIDSARLESEAMRRGIRLFLDRLYYPPQVQKKPSAFRSSWAQVYRKLRHGWYTLTGYRLPMMEKDPPPCSDYVLEFTEDISRLAEFEQRTATDYSLRVFATDGVDVTFVHKGMVVRRMSPMIARLARLHG